MKRAYRLVCTATGRRFEDDGVLLVAPSLDTERRGDHEPVSDIHESASNRSSVAPASILPSVIAHPLLRTDYAHVPFTPGPTDDGLYRFDFWLPVIRRLEGSSAPVTYRSKALAGYLDLPQLYITFSGYWPERGVHMLTGTFKECEAYSVCARCADTSETLVVASAGNTARAFARACSENDIPLVVVIPEANLDALWLPGGLGSTVRVVAVGDGGDYTDAINASAIIADLPGYRPEGGARNVARRDGMATTLLSAIETIGDLPGEYFQAVGSGTGAIAAWEASLRYLQAHRNAGHGIPSGGGEKAGRSSPMRLRLSQNAPFQPMTDSWNAGSRELIDYGEEDAKHRLSGIGARVLANRTPPYSVTGGLFDALMATDGRMTAVENEAAYRAAELFEELEGIDPSPAAAVAIASLLEEVKLGTVDRDRPIMLNVTGGGYKRIRRELNPQIVRPDVILGKDQLTREAIQDALD